MATNKNNAANAAPVTDTTENPVTEDSVMEARITEAQIRAESKAAQQSIRQEERVEIYIERASGNDDPNLFVSVNGYNCLLPKGKTSLVPKSVAEEISRARRAQQQLDATIDAMKEAAAKQPV